MEDWGRLVRVGRLCEETGLTHAEIGRMQADRVERLLIVQETVEGWREAQREREARKW